MNKEEILKKSQEENEGKLDEREMIVFGKASRVGMLVGVLLCVTLVLVSDLILNKPELAFAGFMMYFAMQGSSNIAIYKHLKNRTKLIYGIVEILFAVIYAVCVVVKSMG